MGYEVLGVEQIPQRCNSSHRGDVLGKRQCNWGRQTVLLSGPIHEQVSVISADTRTQEIKRIKINEDFFFHLVSRKAGEIREPLITNSSPSWEHSSMLLTNLP